MSVSWVCVCMCLYAGVLVEVLGVCVLGVWVYECVLGGVAGVAISYLLSFVLNTIATNMMGPSYDMYGNIVEGAKTYISIIPLWLALAGIGFSSFVGMLSGYIPANKAVKISALTAIKND